VESILQKGALRAREKSVPFMEKIRVATGIRPLTYVPVHADPEVQIKKEKSAEELLRVEEGRRRAIIMQLKSLFERVESADNKTDMALQVLAEKTAEVDGLKKKQKQKAQNELDVLKAELARYL